MGYTIDGGIPNPADTTDDPGIYLTGSDTKNNTIKNCVVRRYNYAIWLVNLANNNTVTNCTSTESFLGVHAQNGAYNNTIVNSTFNNNVYGMAVCDAGGSITNYNTFINNTAMSNSDRGFHFTIGLILPDKSTIQTI